MAFSMSEATRLAIEQERLAAELVSLVEATVTAQTTDNPDIVGLIALSGTISPGLDTVLGLGLANSRNDEVRFEVAEHLNTIAGQNPLLAQTLGNMLVSDHNPVVNAAARAHEFLSDLVTASDVGPFV